MFSLVNVDPQVLFCGAAFRLSDPHRILVPGDALLQVIIFRDLKQGQALSMV